MDALEIITAVRAACVEAGEADPLDELGERRLKHHGFDGAQVWVEDGGFALVRDGELTLAVAPESRGSGIGGRLAAEAAGADEPAGKAWSHGGHPAAARLADAHGWRRTRDLWVMRRPTATPLPALEVPEGVTIRGYDDGDAAPLLEVNATAFAHHPEQGGMDAADLAERMDESWWDPAGLLVATDAASGELLGFHWTKQHDAATGEVYVVAVGPAAQGRGLGRVLTLAGLEHLAGLGVEEVLLYVESDNEAAVHVYSALGFGHAQQDTHVQYSR